MIAYDCAEQLNAIINHPEVISGHLLDMEPPLDVTPVLERGGFGVLGEGYGFLMDKVTEDTFEVHTSILPEYRNKSHEITKRSMLEVFEQTDVKHIITRIRDNEPAKRLALSVGMRKLFDEDGFEFFGISHNQVKACP